MNDLMDYKKSRKHRSKYTYLKEFVGIGDSDGNSPTSGGKAKETKKYYQRKKTVGTTHISIGISCEKKEGISMPKKNNIDGKGPLVKKKKAIPTRKILR